MQSGSPKRAPHQPPNPYQTSHPHNPAVMTSGVGWSPVGARGCCGTVGCPGVDAGASTWPARWIVPASGCACVYVDSRAWCVCVPGIAETPD
jgi:hypothetical protein